MIKFFLIFILIVSANILAVEIDKIRAGDNLQLVAERNFDLVRMKYSGSIKNYMEDLKKWNPQIEDWEHPPRKQQIYVDYPYAYHITGSSWAPELDLEKEHDEFKQKFSLYAYYASTFGSYTEDTAEQTVLSEQNFPMTFGTGFSLSEDNAGNRNKQHIYLVGSMYWAKASRAKVTGNSQTTTTEFAIPGEIGGNLYYQYYIPETQLGLYTGYDYERLNTFNTDELVYGSPIVVNTNKIHYGTAGIFKRFSPFDFDIMLKGSYSRSVVSSTSGSTPLKGMKYIINFSYFPDTRFSFNVFYKHHELKGATDLKINRIGFTLGIFVF